MNQSSYTPPPLSQKIVEFSKEFLLCCYIALLLVFLGGLESQASDIIYAGSGNSSVHQDYAELQSGGSVTTKVELQVDYKASVIVAVHNGSSFTSHPSFAGVSVEPSRLVNSAPNTNKAFKINGAIYTDIDNVSVYVSDSIVYFVHEQGEQYGKIKGYFYPHYTAKDIKPGQTTTISYSDLKDTKGVKLFKLIGNTDLNSYSYNGDYDLPGVYRGNIQITATIP